MLAVVVSSQVTVPLAEPPVMNGDRINRWKPATVTKTPKGELFLVVFTDKVQHAAFAQRTGYRYALQTSVEFVISVPPPNHGIRFNDAADNGLEWRPRRNRRVHGPQAQGLTRRSIAERDGTALFAQGWHGPRVRPYSLKQAEGLP
jgi:hypothetical protein